MNEKKPSLGIKETKSEHSVSNGTTRQRDPSASLFAIKQKNPPADVPATRPKNPLANVLPSQGFVLEIDGKLKSEYETADQAMTSGLELKKKFPYIQVIVYGAKERTRTLVTLNAPQV
jgi:hypothetical protein